MKPVQAGQSSIYARGRATCIIPTSILRSHPRTAPLPRRRRRAPGTARTAQSSGSTSECTSLRVLPVVCAPSNTTSAAIATALIDHGHSERSSPPLPTWRRYAAHHPYYSSYPRPTRRSHQPCMVPTTYNQHPTNTLRQARPRPVCVISAAGEFHIREQSPLPPPPPTRIATTPPPPPRPLDHQPTLPTPTPPRQFGRSSYPIHEKSCKKKFLAVQAKVPTMVVQFSSVQFSSEITASMLKFYCISYAVPLSPPTLLPSYYATFIRTCFHRSCPQINVSRFRSLLKRPLLRMAAAEEVEAEAAAAVG